jgi:hypothetical protein
MDAATIVTIAVSITGVGIALAGWIFETNRSVGKLESNMNEKFGILQKDFDKQLGEVREELEHQGTMIEPFWNTLCENLPTILKMHNSPDPLWAVLNGDPTVDEVESLICRIQSELKVAIDKGEDAKAYGYIWALAMARARKSRLIKSKEK